MLSAFADRAGMGQEGAGHYLFNTALDVANESVGLRDLVTTPFRELNQIRLARPSENHQRQDLQLSPPVCVH